MAGGEREARSGEHQNTTNRPLPDPLPEGEGDEYNARMIFLLEGKVRSHAF